MDQIEAVELLAAVDHTAYVLERATAAVAACVTKREKAEAACLAADDAAEQAALALIAAEESNATALAAAAEIPDHLRDLVATHHPEILAAHAETAQAAGGVN